MERIQISFIVSVAVLSFLSLPTTAFRLCPHQSCMHLKSRSLQKKSTKTIMNVQMRSRDSPSALHAFFDGKSNVESATQSVGNINKLYVRCSWISW